MENEICSTEKKDCFIKKKTKHFLNCKSLHILVKELCLVDQNFLLLLITTILKHTIDRKTLKLSLYFASSKNNDVVL